MYIGRNDQNLKKWPLLLLLLLLDIQQYTITIRAPVRAKKKVFKESPESLQCEIFCKKIHWKEGESLPDLAGRQLGDSGSALKKKIENHSCIWQLYSCPSPEGKWLLKRVSQSLSKFSPSGCLVPIFKDLNQTSAWQEN